MSSSKGAYYSGLKQMAKVSNSSLGLRKTFNSIAKSTAKALRSNGCRVLLLDSQKKYLITVGSHGLSDLYLRKGPLDARKSLPDILDGKVVLIPDATKDKRVQHPEMAEAHRVSSILGFPVIAKEETVGQIRVYTHEPHEFSEADKNFLGSVANISAVLLERAELQQFLEKDFKARKKPAELAQTPQLPTTSLRPTEFAHPSEAEFARLLDFYRLEWLYEPRSFPLKWNGSDIAEMFTPDFYLPELDFYVELT
ncbi:MAG: GAF domain-containing protein, partial [Dehalococcoidia bacterium]|nr:GAF domain-containing protein [Dehalococcoidia bacterium]